MKRTMKNNFLSHYGMLGMRWGVRKERYSDEKSSGIRLEKGSTISRVASAGDEKIGGMKYAAFKPEDIEEYEFALGTSGKFSFKYTLKETLISPNEKRQVDAFLETVKESSVKKVAASLKAKDKFASIKDIEKELAQAVSGNTKSRIRTYDKFMQLLYSKELEPVRQAYFTKLSKEGYNMIIDSSDKGVVSDAPIIIFSGSKSLQFTSKEKINPDD